MPSWKKVATSGSAASFSSLFVNTAITASVISGSEFTGSLFGTASYASYALNGGVTQILAGPNITISPLSGKGQVTISSTGTGSGNFNTATGSYGSFYDTTTQINPVANIPRSMSFNETAITNGVSLSGSVNPFNTYIKTENAGVYNLQFSAQLDKTDSGTDSVDIWIRKNGIDLVDTATVVTLTGNNDKSVAAWNWFVQSAANDYYQIIWSSADTNMRLLAEASSSIHPGIPSVIATVNRVDQFLSNTGSFNGDFNGAFTGSLSGTASQAVSSSYALTASYALSALSSSYAATASFANAFPDQGFQFTQVTGSSTWTINHNLNTYTPLVDVYDSIYNQLIPASVSSISANTTQITFSTAQAGYAIISKGSGISSQNAITASYAVTASYALSFSDQGFNFVQSTGATTWNIAHNLNTFTPLVDVYSSTYHQLIPAEVISVDANNTQITFSTAQAGYTIVSRGSGVSSQTVVSSSFATTASYASTVGFNFQQLTPSNTWTVNHNLGNQHPLVQVYDSSHLTFIPQSISGSSLNTVIITFSSAQTGYVRVV